MIHTDSNSILQETLAEAEKATAAEAREYLLGAAHDGTFNRLHGTLRISQADPRWLDVLRKLLSKLGSRSWVYREGKRDVWVIESTCRLDQSNDPANDLERTAFARGYFDAEGGSPRNLSDRFYLQFTQKDRADLVRLRSVLLRLGIECGKVHNPSERVDPNYWRFYVLTNSHQKFLSRVGSWHPRKRLILQARRGDEIMVETDVLERKVRLPSSPRSGS